MEATTIVDETLELVYQASVLPEASMPAFGQMLASMEPEYLEALKVVASSPHKMVAARKRVPVGVSAEPTTTVAIGEDGGDVTMFTFTTMSGNSYQLPEAKRMRYAIEHNDKLRFYAVDRPDEGKWKGYTFVKEQAGPEYYPVKERGAREAVLIAIARDWKSAIERYGLELGHCAICGLPLTDEASRSRGIGPICAAKWGV